MSHERLDDFGGKGPAPKAAPLSWDKSPVASAHYFLFERVDKNNPKCVLRERLLRGVPELHWGREDRKAIKFQCLERGGV